MRVNTSVALHTSSTNEFEVESFIEQMRDVLCDLDPNVQIKILAVGSEFGGPPLSDLIIRAENLRWQLLSQFWGSHDRRLLLQSLRLAHAICSMDRAKIQKIVEDFDQQFKRD